MLEGLEGESNAPRRFEGHHVPTAVWLFIEETN